MARLFITPRELNFISDITQEVIKDANGTTVYYYTISELKTLAHDVYNESIKKVFDNPIAIDAMVDAVFQSETKVNQFGIDQQYRLEVFIQYRDLADKGINVCIGDFFSFNDVFYEIADSTIVKNIYGQAENKAGVKVVGTKAREGQFSELLHGPTDITNTDADAVQKTFVQQRGQVENSEGPTGDVRDLQRNGVLDAPLTGPREVSERGALADDSHHGSAFYDE